MEEWSYRKLCDAYREEKATNALGKLASDFDQSLMNLLGELHQKAAGSSDHGRELENARRMALELLRLRRHKIIVRALMVTEHGDVEGMGSREHALYDQVRDLCAREDGELAAQVLKPLGKPSGAAMPGAAGADAAAVRVHILKDIQAYKTPEGEWGPYSSGQTVELPAGEAGWMLKGGLATDSANYKPAPSPPNVTPKKLKLLADIPAYDAENSQHYGPFAAGQVVELPSSETSWLLAGRLAEEVA